MALTHPGSGTGNMPMVRRATSGFMAAGHKAVASDFYFTIKGVENLRVLVQSTQVPEIRRKLVETKGPLGVGVPQQGGPKKDGELTITFAENVTGDVYRELRRLSDTKTYFECRLALVCEEKPGSVAPLIYDFDGAWIELDPSDLSVEDDSSTIKPSGTLHYAWFETRSASTGIVS